MKRLFYLLFFTGSIFSLEQQPWFGDVYEFHLTAGYAFSWYRDVDGAIAPLNETSDDHLLFGDLEFAFTPQWSANIDAEIAQTPRQSFGMRSVAFQLRYLLYDDVIGDFVSLATGASFRYVFPEAVRDISCPYGSNDNIEFNLSIGKEIDYFYDWRYRIWGFGALGFANEGSPWLRGVLAFEANCKEKHLWAVFLDTYKGYGRKNFIDIDSFHGYARVRARWVDLAFRYGYRLEPWGTIRLEYRRRVHARLCPENVDTIMISFLFPFSF